MIENDWANIPPKTVKAEWEPIVTTEEFERGLAILALRNHKPMPTKRYFYLLQGLVYLEQKNGKLQKLTCGRPNANRARGGVSYYCVPSRTRISSAGKWILKFLNTYTQFRLVPLY